jgi:hypothetical protein
MQREKLYNLQSKAYFNCILFVSKKTKLCATSFRRCEKSFFLHKRERTTAGIATFVPKIFLRNNYMGVTNSTRATKLA